MRKSLQPVEPPPGGLTAIEANVLARRAGDWEDKLYYSLRDEHESHIRVRCLKH